MRDVIHTDKAPAAIGPYVQALRSDGWIFTAGQVGLDPATGQLSPGEIDVPEGGPAKLGRLHPRLSQIEAGAGGSTGDEAFAQIGPRKVDLSQ